MIKFKGIRMHQTGNSDVLTIEEICLDEIPSDHVLIKNEYSGVNFIDIYHRTGLYPQELPFTPGMEGGGTVVEIGNNIDDIKKGDKVVYIGAFGSYAQYSLVPVRYITLVPEKLDIKTAIASLLQGLTAEFLANFIYPLKKGDTCLIHAGAGGVGLLLIQIAKLKGAKVIATVSNIQKANYVINAGADSAIIYDNYEFEEELKTLTKDEGVDVVYDSVGNSTFEQSINCLKPFGMMVSYGNSSGPVPSISPLELSKKGSLYLTRPSILHYIENSGRFKNGTERLFNYLISEEVNINIGLELPLSDAAKAHRALESRETYGKILLNME